ncbi:MAG: M48 family metallopeptidase [Tannerella sp.]|nr:M48 family metallopeptidase [Tannerella sp.]
MKYVGIQTQKHRNNIRSTLMLCLFPCIILALAWTFFLVSSTWLAGEAYAPEDGGTTSVARATEAFIHTAPWILGICLIWFLTAYCANTSIINAATGSRPLERRENKRVYNMVENLCIASHTDMPKINIIEDHSLNAFASGINKRNFTVTLSRGIIDRLNDAELEAVIAHELTHIRNNDVKALIVSIVFVGIFSFLTQILLRTLLSGRLRTRNDSKNSGGIIVVILLILLLAAVGYFITLLMRFAISRNREYMADAGSAEMTKNPLALASALRKISADSCIEAVTQNDVAQLFIDNPMKKSFINSLFATHPPIGKRIHLLEQF